MKCFGVHDIVTDVDLVGFSPLWSFVLNAANDQVFTEAMALLVSLHVQVLR
jgi:hypothetical protein